MEKNPVTMREITMHVEQDERERLLRWVSGTEILGEEIEVTISGWNVGPLGKFRCEIKEWIPTPTTNKK